jgi:hypothetical protein
MTAASQHITSALKYMDGPADRHGQPAGLAGVLKAIERSGPTMAQRQFVSDLRAVPAVVEEDPWPHPGRNLPAPARQLGGSGAIGDNVAAPPSGISLDDYEFLRGLPSHPAMIPYADARRLLALQKAAHRPGADPADRDLVEEVAQPVADWHDEQAARVEQRNAEGHAFTPIPASAASAMADAIAAEIPVLTPGEAVQRAHDAVSRIGAQRVAAHADRVAKARAAVDALNNRNTQA